MRGNLKDFFTDFMPEDYHGVFEWTPRSTVPTLAWDSGEASGDRTANCCVSAFSGDILSVNDNGGKGGFEFKKALSPAAENGERLTR